LVNVFFQYRKRSQNEKSQAGIISRENAKPAVKFTASRLRG